MGNQFMEIFNTHIAYNKIVYKIGVGIDYFFFI